MHAVIARASFENTRVTYLELHVFGKNTSNRLTAGNCVPIEQQQVFPPGLHCSRVRSADPGDEAVVAGHT